LYVYSDGDGGIKIINMKNILLALFIFISSQASARKFYVNYATGNDANNGLLMSTPWKTLTKVNAYASNFASGDSILFNRGNKFNGYLRLSGKTNIYIGAYGTGTDPMFWGTGASLDPLIWIMGCTYITIYGINITDTTISQTDRTIQANIKTAIQYDNSSYNTIRKCTMNRVGVGVFYSTNTSHHNTMDSCDIGNMRMVRNTPTSVNNNDDYGANPTVISSPYNTITHNYFHDCWALSYDYTYDGGAIEFFGGGTSNNFVAYNTFIDCNGTVEQGSNNGGLMENNVFAYNKVINCGKLFYINNSVSSGFLVTVSNLQFYNNVVVESYVNRLNLSTLGSMATSSSASNIVAMKNNIFVISSGIAVVNTSQFSGTQLSHSYNIFKLTNRSSFNLTLGTGEVKDSTLTLFTNATNVNPLYWDYSPTTSVGLGINAEQSVDFSGKTLPIIPRIGILEKKSKATAKINSVVKQKYGIYLGQSYQGGVIGYIDSTGRHGLIMSVSSGILPNSSWSYSSLDCEATSDYGLQNSVSISDYDDQAIANNYCLNYKLGNYSDWYFPSIAELKLIYNAGMLPKKDRKVIVDDFWSSSESDSGNAMYINRRGIVKYASKSLKKNVMPIKYF
jgi:hypothetical protein